MPRVFRKVQDTEITKQSDKKKKSTICEGKRSQQKAAETLPLTRKVEKTLPNERSMTAIGDKNFAVS